MREAFTVKDEHIEGLNLETDSMVYEINARIRSEVKKQVDSGKLTMIALERLSGLKHSTLFHWYAKKFDIIRIDLLFRLAYVLRLKIKIR